MPDGMFPQAKLKPQRAHKVVAAIRTTMEERKRLKPKAAAKRAKNDSKRPKALSTLVVAARNRRKAHGRQKADEKSSVRPKGKHTVDAKVGERRAASHAANLEARRGFNAARAAERVAAETSTAPTYAELLSDIQCVTTEHLVTIWVRASKMLSLIRADRGYTPGDVLAFEVVSAIEREWGKRLKGAEADGRYFKWPSTAALHGESSLKSDEWYDSGFFSMLGYHVGNNSELQTHTRIYLLNRIFSGTLPPLNDPTYIIGWGTARSEVRLRKMANSLASFARRAKNHPRDYSRAIAEWEFDLKYLYDAYYIGVFRFAWPAI